MQVLDIIIPDRYRGSKRIYEHDIAFLRVRFVVTRVVLPICIDFNDQFNPKAGDVGIVRLSFLPYLFSSVFMYICE